MDDRFYSSGITLEGAYAIQPMDVDALDKLIRGEKPLPTKQFKEIETRIDAAKAGKLGVKAGVDVKDLGSAGWGIIFAQADAKVPQIQEALQSLIGLRKKQAGERFRIFDDKNGFRSTDDKEKFLQRNGVGPGPADPDRCVESGPCVPYYLLIVGSPEQIPYSFQSELDLQYAVGRIHFDQLEDYRVYAESVVVVEEKRVKLARQATFFGVGNPVSGVADTLEPGAKQALEFLIDPLTKQLICSKRYPGWKIETVRNADATKAALQRCLGGNTTPALLFTTGHGLDVAASTERRLSLTEYQGALVCSNHIHNLPIKPQESVFAGRDLQHDANLLGLIAFFNACFGAGTPQYDAYTRLHNELQLKQPGPRLQLTPKPFVAELPRRMLSAPAGGALAVIGHVERTWSSTFLWKTTEDGSLPPQTAAFESLLYQMIHGFPVGAAMEYLNARYQELTAELQPYLYQINDKKDYNRLEFCKKWMATIDAQWYTIVGDPAVRLPVVDETEVAPRPILVSIPSTTDEANRTPAKSAVTPEQVTAIPLIQQAAKEASVSTTVLNDPRFDQSYTVVPEPTKDLAELKEQHPDLYAAYVAHVKDGYKNNARIFDDVRRAFLRSHNSTVAMYWLLFLVGLSTVITGIVLAAWKGDPAGGAIFLGVGVAAFVTYFIGRSTQSVEENLIYITWLGVIYNSYWTYLAWTTKRESALTELTKATNAALQQLEKLLDRHAKSTQGRFRLGKTDMQPTPEPDKAHAPAAADTA